MVSSSHRPKALNWVALYTKLKQIEVSFRFDTLLYEGFKFI